jgi:hypothetical protein
MLYVVLVESHNLSLNYKEAEENRMHKIHDHDLNIA